jgi:Tfp pilus assembly protein PilF
MSGSSSTRRCGDEIACKIKNERIQSMRRVIVCALILLLAAGCASQFKQQRELSRPMVALAMEKVQQNDIQAALIELKKAAMANPSDPEVYYGFALAYWKSGKGDKAIENVDKAIDLGDKLGLDHPGLKSEAYNLRGTILFGEGKNEDAIAAFRNALKDELYQTPEYSYHNLATVYLAMQNVALASEAIQKALDNNPHYAPAWEVLSKIYLSQGRTSDAIDALKQAILEFPGYAEAHWEIAQLYLQTGNPSQAKEHVVQVIQLDPDGLFGQLASDMLKELK